MNASLAVANANLYRKLARAEASARAEAGFLKQRAQKKIEGIIGESAAMRAVFASMQKVIDSRDAECLRQRLSGLSAKDAREIGIEDAHHSTPMMSGHSGCPPSWVTTSTSGYSVASQRGTMVRM